jgi:hypothetical protein
MLATPSGRRGGATKMGQSLASIASTCASVVNARPGHRAPYGHRRNKSCNSRLGFSGQSAYS